MTPPPRPRLVRIAWTLTAFYAGFHFVMTHIPPAGLPAARVSDKLLHLLSYGFLTGCLYVALWLGVTPIFRAAFITIAAVTTFAAVDELLQAPVGRSPEMIDWVMDTTGALIAVICFTTLRIILDKRRRALSRFAAAPVG